MPKLFLFDRFHTKEADTLLIKLLLSQEDIVGGLFQKIHARPFQKMVHWVDDPYLADYVVLPINYSMALQKRFYLKSFFDFAKKHNLKVLIVNHGDYSKAIKLPVEGYVLRTSSYRSKLLSHEIIIPAFVEDLGKNNYVTYRSKTSKFPTVGFSGMVGLPSKYKELKYQLRLVRQWFLIKYKGESSASYQGLYYRRKAIRLIRKTKTCKHKFYIRKSFSRNMKTIQGSPEQLRKEFIDSIIGSDLALVVRGDGNFSLRLFEVLSLGKVPLFIDTDTPLPLENEIDYDSFILRVNYRDINKLPQIIDDFWKSVSEEQFIAMQKRAREVFETKLRADVFYRYLFSSKLQ